MTKRLPPVSAELESKLRDMAKLAGEVRRNDNGAEYLKLKEAAWDLLPEPKASWDYFPQTISRTSVEVIPTLGVCSDLDVWIDRLYETHFDDAREDVYTNLIVCHSLYQCGRHDEAREIAQQVLDLHGPRWFTGEYRPYLKLAQEES